jgi:hypothetical protein
MTKAELSKETVAALKALAKKKKIPLPADTKKADIIAVLLKSGSGSRSRAKAGTAARSKGKATTRTGKKSASAAVKNATKASSVKKKVSAPKKKAGAKRTAAKKESAEQTRRTSGEPLSAQERIENAKYFTGPGGRDRSFTKTLPVEYGEERISLLARDPDTVFAFWEVPKAQFDRELAHEAGKSRLCVRIYDVTGIVFDGTNATSVIDQEVYERVGSWYFHLHRPDHRFCADIGLKTPDGRFRTIARSKVLSMPRAGVSDLVETERMLSEPDLRKLYGVEEGHPEGISSALARELQRRRKDITSPGVSSWGLPGARRK